MDNREQTGDDEQPFGRGQGRQRARRVMQTARAPRTGALLRVLRRQHAMLQQGLAGAAGVTQQGLAAAELGKTAVSWEWVRSVASALPLSARERIALLDCYAEERNFLDLTGVSADVRIALVAALERARRVEGLPGACLDCDAGAHEACSCPRPEQLELAQGAAPMSANGPVSSGSMGDGPGLAGLDSTGARRPRQAA